MVRRGCGLWSLWLLALAELYAPSPQLLGLERRDERKLAKDISTGDVTCKQGILKSGGEGVVPLQGTVKDTVTNRLVFAHL